MIDLAATDLESTTTARVNIAATMSSLEMRLGFAQDMLAKFDQPVSFGSTDDVVVISTDSSRTLYSHVQLEFAVNSVAQGVLFFVENNATREKLLLQLVNGSLLFQYDNVDVTMTVRSDAQLCQRCWFKVTATRYITHSHLFIWCWFLLKIIFIYICYIIIVFFLFPDLKRIWISVFFCCCPQSLESGMSLPVIYQTLSVRINNCAFLQTTVWLYDTSYYYQQHLIANSRRVNTCIHLCFCHYSFTNRSVVTSRPMVVTGLSLLSVTSYPTT